MIFKKPRRLLHGLDNSIGHFNYINNFHLSNLLDNILYIYGVFKMNSAKEIIVTVLACLALGTLIGFFLGEKSMCERDKDYAYSAAFSKCIKIGKENYK